MKAIKRNVLGVAAIAVTAALACATPASAAEEAAKPAAAAPAKKVASANPQSGNAEAIEVGTKIYFTWCVQCHGQKANGESRFGAYAGDLTRFWRGYKEFVKIVLNGRTGNLGMMPAWKDYMDEETIGKIGAFLETLAEPEANWQ
jgi:mono/diheme cytochrome c family protein